MVTIAICLGNSLFMFRGKFKLLDIFSSIVLIELDLSKIHTLFAWYSETRAFSTIFLRFKMKCGRIFLLSKYQVNGLNLFCAAFH